MNCKLTIGWLYPKMMNLYGDRGNVIALIYRAKARGIKIIVKDIEIKDYFDDKAIDLAFFGGGQDKEQSIVSSDLMRKKDNIFRYHEAKKPMLAVCGGYQLLGNFFQTISGEKIQGIGIFDVNTFGSKNRMVGDIVIRSKYFNNLKLVGFENHSGRTFLANKTDALGIVVRGGGNNGVDNTEGIVINNFIGTYLHGPFLSKNWEIADWFIEKALEKKYNRSVKLKKINSELENKAREYVIRNC
jgi:hypothetical protein